MDPLSVGLITGGLGLAGSMFSSQTSAQNTQEQIAANEKMVGQQEQFQEQMSNTAYQRASADMQKAGLNPAMMFGSGSAASTPAGASISQTVNKTSPFANLGQQAAQAISTAVQAKTMDKMADEMANLKTENAKIMADVDLSRASATDKTQAAKLNDARARLVDAETPQARNEALTAVNQMSINPTVRKYADQLSFGGEAASKVVNPIAQLGSSAARIWKGW